MVRKGAGYAIAYLMWFAAIALGGWLAYLSLFALQGVLGRYAGESLTRAWQADFLNKVFAIALGLLLLAGIIVVEEYLKRGVERGELRRRLARVFGVELLLVFAADLCLMGLQGGSLWLRWLILGSELVAGAALVLYGWFRHKPARVP